jgi:hypothetical protein
MRDKRGGILGFVAFILPITMFILNFTLTYGLAEYAKSTLITAAREGSRTYAVTHSVEKGKESSTYIVQNTLLSNLKYFDPANDVIISD